MIVKGVSIFNCIAINDTSNGFTFVSTIKKAHDQYGIQDFFIGYIKAFNSYEEAQLWCDMHNCVTISYNMLNTITKMIRNKRNECHYVEPKHLEEVKVEIKNKLGLTLSLL